MTNIERKTRGQQEELGTDYALIFVIVMYIIGFFLHLVGLGVV